MNLLDLQQQYAKKRTESKKLFEIAKTKIPGAVNGNLRFFKPFPTIFAKANGAWLTDVDKHTYVDYLLSYGALMLGHGHPVVREALEKVWTEQGTSSFGAPHVLELEMTEELINLYPSFEELRFTNSGLEATLLALRLALAYTGKTHIAKFEGHYHGSHDQVLISVSPEIQEAGDQEKPRSLPDSLGLPDYYLEHTIVLPFNNWESCAEILKTNRHRIGAVIMEPVQAGYIPADKQFLIKLRELTKQLGIILIFDEVKTGFRVSMGGAQVYYNVYPDLTALGKVVGGGFPIGIVAGSRDILEICSNERSSKRDEVLFHSGTFNGNPVAIAAGLATIRYLNRPGYFEELLQKTQDLRQGIEELAKKHTILLKTIGIGTIFNILITQEDVQNYRDLDHNNQQLRLALDYLLMENGVYSKPLNRFSMSTAHGPEEIQATLAAFDKSFVILKNMME